MLFPRKHLLTIASSAAALVLSVSSASAQRATFTLPFEAHFGRMTLPPGEYRLRAPVAMSNARVIYLEGNGKVQAMLPIDVDTTTLSDEAHLEFVQVGGSYFAEKFVSGATGMTYEFSVPKSVRADIVAKARVTKVPVDKGAVN